MAGEVDTQIGSGGVDRDRGVAKHHPTGDRRAEGVQTGDEISYVSFRDDKGTMQIGDAHTSPVVGCESVERIDEHTTRSHRIGELAVQQVEFCLLVMLSAAGRLDSCFNSPEDEVEGSLVLCSGASSGTGPEIGVTRVFQPTVTIYTGSSWG